MIRNHPLLAFFGCTFAISWGIAGMASLLLTLDVIDMKIVPIGYEGLARPNPEAVGAQRATAITVRYAASVYVPVYLGVFGPTISALVVSALTAGRAHVTLLLKRVLVWHVPLRWWMAALLLPILGQWLTMLLASFVTDIDFARWGPASWREMGYFLIFGLTVGPLSEEIGWRGWALPRLAASIGARLASLVVGAIWAVWHLPAFYFPHLEQLLLPPGLEFVPFAVIVVAASVLISWVYLSSRSLLLAVLCHFMVNFSLLSIDRDPDAALVWSGAAVALLGAGLILLLTTDLGYQAYRNSEGAAVNC